MVYALCIKTDTRTLSPSPQESLRIRAAKAVLDGHTQVKVAGILGVPRQTVGLWVKAHRRGGLRSLKAKKRGRPKGGTLLPWQAAQVVRAITDRTPDQLKLPFYLWTRGGVGGRPGGGGAGVWTRSPRRSGLWQSGREPRFTGETRWGCVPTMSWGGLTGAGGRRRSSLEQDNGSAAT